MGWFRRLTRAHLMLLLVVCMPYWPPQATQDVVETTPWGRDYFPNIRLLDQDGRPVRFFDELIEGKVVAINFIFTGCTDSCPLETARLRQVQKLLGDRVGKDIFFYSISIDPYNDTPTTLKRYAEKFGIGPGWTLLTGEPDDIEVLRRSLGLFIEGLENGRSKDHNLSLIIGNQATGRWMKASPFESPYILADRLAKSLHNWKQADMPAVAEATDIRTPSSGEQIFRTRCSSCHSLGDAGPNGAGGIGPDLLGVTRQRDPRWLVRWLKEPDRMLAEKDPLALLLYTQYKSLAMPNLRLGDTEVTALLTFIEEQTRRLQTPATAKNGD
ncbi:Cytochrome oxidase Cu insertion factor, SCO1/SenC/PrrC family [Pseudomonas guariconensis]|uniref:SCO family protein n=1 Tax=Pseudomonas guariconensis TaxID=1288410 RepID=UPI00088A4675|nr:Cytochrome oxidase Cu insertion factor, SCO1/SenC/PrrC family [Pseudomonas guariconensis]